MIQLKGTLLHERGITGLFPTPSTSSVSSGSLRSETWSPVLQGPRTQTSVPPDVDLRGGAVAGELEEPPESLAPAHRRPLQETNTDARERRVLKHEDAHIVQLSTRRPSSAVSLLFMYLFT